MSAGPTRLKQRPRGSGQGGAGGPGGPGAGASKAEQDSRFRARRRSLRLRRWLRIGLPATVLVLLAVAAWVVLGSSFLAVSAVRVAGTHRLTAAQVEQAAAIQDGRPLARLDTGAAAHRVAQLPVVRSVTVSRSWPHTVLITVVERVPVATARTTAGWAVLDADGVVMVMSSGRPPSLVLLSMDPVTVQPGALRAAAAVAADLPASLRAKVTDVTAATEDSVQLHLTDGGLVRWGSAQDGATKARVLAVLLPRHARVYDVTAPGFATTS